MNREESQILQYQKYREGSEKLNINGDHIVILEKRIK